MGNQLVYNVHVHNKSCDVVISILTVVFLHCSRRGS